MKCEYCGRIINIGLEECKYCGAPVEFVKTFNQQLIDNTTFNYSSAHFTTTSGIFTK